MAANYAQVFGDLGGAVSDLFGAAGSRKSAGSYGEAAGIADENAIIAANAVKIKDTQISRQIYQVLGTQQADVAGAGMSSSGSALDLLSSSASQGALAKAMAEQQGAITVNAYKEQANQFRSMAEAAKGASTAQTIGGVLQLAGAVAALA